MSKSCDWIRSRIARYRDDALPADEHDAVARHLAECAACRDLLAAQQQLDDLAREASEIGAERGAPQAGDAGGGGEPEGPPEPGEPGEFLARLGERYDLEAAARLRRAEMKADFAAGEKPTMASEEVADAPLEPEITRARGGPVRELASWWSRAALWRWATVVGAAAAAVVVVVVLTREPQAPHLALEEAGRGQSRELLGAPEAPAPTEAVTMAEKAPGTEAEVPTEVVPSSESLVTPEEERVDAEVGMPDAQVSLPDVARPVAEHEALRSRALPVREMGGGATEGSKKAGEIASLPRVIPGTGSDDGSDRFVADADESHEAKQLAVRGGRADELEAPGEVGRVGWAAEGEPPPEPLQTSGLAQAWRLLDVELREQRRDDAYATAPSAGRSARLVRLLPTMEAQLLRTQGERQPGELHPGEMESWTRAGLPPAATLWLSVADGWYSLLTESEEVSIQQPQQLARRAGTAYERALVAHGYARIGRQNEEETWARDRAAREKERTLWLQPQSAYASWLLAPVDSARAEQRLAELRELLAEP